MPRRIPHPLVSVEGVTDPVIRMALVSIRANFETLFGLKGNRDEYAITRGDLNKLGFMTYDEDGNMVGRNIRAKQSLTDQDEKSIQGQSAVWISDVFDATDGVAAGSHTLETIIPANAYIIQSWYEVLTGFTGAIGSTIGVGIETDDAGGIVAPGVLASGWLTAGVKSGIQDGTTANFSEKTTADRTLQVDVTGSLTGGRARIHVQYIVSE